jgi:ActR/RegA family two-component response regulator
MSEQAGGKRDLLLLVDGDPRTVSVVAPLAAARKLGLVKARTAVAALEIVQRVADSFGCAVVNLELPDIPGLAVAEALRQFYPTLPVVCLTGVLATANGPCLSKPVDGEQLSAGIDQAIAGLRSIDHSGMFTEEAMSRARARFHASRDLVSAARWLAWGLRDDDTGA